MELGGNAVVFHETRPAPKGEGSPTLAAALASVCDTVQLKKAG